MKTILLVITHVLITTSILAQGNNEIPVERQTNRIFLNVFGDASMVSVNYDKVFLINDAFFLSGKLGAGFYQELTIWKDDIPFPKYFTIPHHITGNLGKGKHFLEFGLGGTFLTGVDKIYIVYPIIGYRLLPFESNKVNLRIYGQLPVAGYNWETFWFVPVGLSLGFSLTTTGKI